MGTKPINNEVLLRQLEWRYAVKQFDPARAISEADWVRTWIDITMTKRQIGMQLCCVRRLVGDSVRW